MTVSREFWERARRRCAYCRREVSPEDAVAVSYGTPRIAHLLCHQTAVREARQ